MWKGLNGNLSTCSALQPLKPSHHRLNLSCHCKQNIWHNLCANTLHPAFILLHRRTQANHLWFYPFLKYIWNYPTSFVRGIMHVVDILLCFAHIRQSSSPGNGGSFSCSKGCEATLKSMGKLIMQNTRNSWYNHKQSIVYILRGFFTSRLRWWSLTTTKLLLHWWSAVSDLGFDFTLQKCQNFWHS